ncbi:hypothetical protein ASPCAL11324 [Aspergillus calidoustus]|uniref:CFEM domain-containing protein n=1 Tax=Aspergillus calidoustus TaxID=454130 RepID=A0A0U5CE90_ASPCI|nr:hypothetical protein ASPCAL11324 [Aspergillus calidoustus]
MDGLPSCTLLCLTRAIGPSSCSLSDLDCICTDVQLTTEVQTCVLLNCSVKDNLRSTRLLYDACDYPVVDDNSVFPSVAIAGAVFSTVAVGLRIAGRLLGSRMGLDDAVIALSLVAALAMSVIGLRHAPLGLGKDIWFVLFDNITKILLLCFCIEVLYISSIALSKISMLLLFLRLFPDQNFRRATYFVLAVAFCWGVATVFATTFSCKPVSHFWHMWDGEHQCKCLSHVHIVSAHSAINIALDVAIIGLPVSTLAKLNLPLGKKIGVCSMFAAGILVTALSIYRFIMSLSQEMGGNITKTFIWLDTWSALEVYLSIISVCMPGVRAFFNYSYRRFTRGVGGCEEECSTFVLGNLIDGYGTPEVGTVEDSAERYTMRGNSTGSADFATTMTAGGPACRILGPR